jgi:hypothetical protein
LKAKLFQSASHFRAHVRRCDRQELMRANIGIPVRLAVISVFSNMGDKRNSAGDISSGFIAELCRASGQSSVRSDRS